MRGVGYAAWEIVVLLTLALAIGFVLGWILRRVLYDTSVARYEERLVAARDERARLMETVRRLQAGARGEGGGEVEPATRRAPSQATARARASDIAARTAGAEPRVHDDLERIHGIGPKIADVLRQMGFTSFRQIARLEADDVSWVAAALGAFPGRIERDGWVESAATEHQKAYGSPP
jgi:predicted flap endonuclease-1-like 5' DNA nuclease